MSVSHYLLYVFYVTNDYIYLLQTCERKELACGMAAYKINT